jgi:hypothetical protein
MPDFTFSFHGSLWLLTPLSQNAIRWIEEHLSEDAQVLGHSIAVEPRYVDPIVAGIEGDGLTVEPR